MNNIITQEQKNKFWKAKPYPHLVIDNFLGFENWRSMIVNMKQYSESYANFNTKIEKNKSTFNRDSAIGNAMLPIVEELTSKHWLQQISYLSGIGELILPLTYANVNSDYKLFHQMKMGGFLGSHVDHSQIYNKHTKQPIDSNVHFLNCIYYVNNTIGGDTCLFGPSGFGEPLAQVETISDRLLIFLHSSNSFHGVNNIVSTGPDHKLTVYMDYYTNLKGIYQLQNHAIYKGMTSMPDFWRHKTTFIPKDWKNMHRYLPAYVEWLMRRRIK